jgi:Kef-type K+ transport system membrane component KefB
VTEPPTPTRRLLRNAVMIAVVTAGAAAVQAVSGVFPAPTNPMVGTTLAIGFLFLVAHLAGRIAGVLRLPRITGYLLVGLLVGPDVLGIVKAEDITNLNLLNRLAIGVIAFIAGAELRPAMLRRRGRSIVIMLLVEIAAVFVFVSALLLAIRDWIPFLAGRELGAVLLLTAVFAAIATIHSPAATIAVLEEEKTEGALAETILGIVVAADVVVVLLVTLTLALARSVLVTGSGLELDVVLLLGWELIGAIVAGAVVGLLIDLYLRFAGARLALLVIVVVLFGDQIARALHVEFMLFLMSAGFFVENVSPTDGEPLIQAVERVSVPAYALFFALAGASIHVTELRILGPIAIVIVLTRAFALYLGCRTGGRLANAPPDVIRYTWMGLVSQAGVALGLVTIAARVLPEAGGEMRTLFLAMIAIHELVGPVLLRMALTRGRTGLDSSGSGEVRQEPQATGA